MSLSIAPSCYGVKTWVCVLRYGLCRSKRPQTFYSSKAIWIKSCLGKDFHRGIYKNFTMSRKTGLILQKRKLMNRAWLNSFTVEKPCKILESLLLPGERLFPTKIQSILQSVKECVLAPPCSCKFRFRCFFSSNPLPGLEEQNRAEGGLSQSLLLRLPFRCQCPKF